MTLTIPQWIVTWLIFSSSVCIAARVLPGLRVRSFWTAVWVAAVYGLLKFFLFWLLVILSFPIVVLTLGLFLFVINAFLLWLTDKVVDGFQIDGFGWALLGSLVVTFIDLVLRALFFTIF